MHGLGTSLTLPAHDPSFPYMFYNLAIPSGTSVVIPAGTVIKTEGYILVSGTLQAQGTATNPVIFTSLNDDSVGGDTNNDGNASSPAPGDWSQLSAQFGGRVEMDHTIVRYGGQAAYPSTLSLIHI